MREGDFSRLFTSYAPSKSAHSGPGDDSLVRAEAIWCCSGIVVCDLAGCKKSSCRFGILSERQD